MKSLNYEYKDWYCVRFHTPGLRPEHRDWLMRNVENKLAWTWQWNNLEGTFVYFKHESQAVEFALTFT